MDQPSLIPGERGGEGKGVGADSAPTFNHPLTATEVLIQTIKKTHLLKSSLTPFPWLKLKNKKTKLKLLKSAFICNQLQLSSFISWDTASVSMRRGQKRVFHMWQKCRYQISHGWASKSSFLLFRCGHSISTIEYVCPLVGWSLVGWPLASWSVDPSVMLG